VLPQMNTGSQERDERLQSCWLPVAPTLAHRKGNADG
jgi:hypothetical protein